MGADFDEREVVEPIRILAWITCHQTPLFTQRLYRTDPVDDEIVHHVGGRRWGLLLDGGTTGAHVMYGVRPTGGEAFNHLLPEGAPAHLRSIELLGGDP